MYPLFIYWAWLLHICNESDHLSFCSEMYFWCPWPAWNKCSEIKEVSDPWPLDMYSIVTHYHTALLQVPSLWGRQAAGCPHRWPLWSLKGDDQLLWEQPRTLGKDLWQGREACILCWGDQQSCLNADQEEHLLHRVKLFLQTASSWWSACPSCQKYDWNVSPSGCSQVQRNFQRNFFYLIDL